MHKIANIGISVLESIALRDFIEDKADIETKIFSNFAEFINQSEKFDFFIVSSDVILSNLDFFLPKKTRTLVISSVENGNSKSFPIIYRSSEIGEIKALIDNLISENTTSEPRGDLSQREIDVLREIVSGKTQKEIADALNISVNTVITHRKNISAKLGIRSVSGLSLYAIMNGFA